MGIVITTRLHRFPRENNNRDGTRKILWLSCISGKMLMKAGRNSMKERASAMKKPRNGFYFRFTLYTKVAKGRFYISLPK